MENIYNALEAEKQLNTLNRLKELLQTASVIEEELQIHYENLTENVMSDIETISFCDIVLTPTIADYSCVVDKINVTAKNSLIKKELKQELIKNTDEMSRKLYDGIQRTIRKLENNELSLPNGVALGMIYAAKNLNNYKEEKECETLMNLCRLDKFDLEKEKVNK